MYISGFKLDAAPTPAVQARQLRQDRQNAFWDSRNKNNDKLDKFPLILTNKMKQLASNNPNNRRLKKHSMNNYVNNKNREYISMNKPGFSGGNINKKKSYDKKYNFFPKQSIIPPNNNNNNSFDMNNNDNNDIVSIFENSFNNSNKINKQQYFIDNNNQIHERNVKKIMPRKPRPSDIMGNIRRTKTAPEASVNNNNNNNNNNKQYHARQTTTYNKKSKQRPITTSIVASPNKIKRTNSSKRKSNDQKKKQQQEKEEEVVIKIPPPVRMYYVIGKGNNSILLMKMFRLRNGWSPVELDDPRANFIWTMYKKTSTFQMLKKCKDKNQPLLINHFPGNSCLVTKKGLFHSLSKYHKNHGTDVGQSVPMTFHLIKDVKDEQYEQFIDRARKLDQQCREQLGKNGSKQKINDEDGKINNEEILMEGENDEGGTPEMPPSSSPEKTQNNNNNMIQSKKKKKTTKKKSSKKIVKPKKRTGAYWIVKPASMTNRGYGIKVVASAEEVMKIVNGTNKKNSNNNTNDDGGNSNNNTSNEEQGDMDDNDDNKTSASKKTSSKKSSTRKEWIVQKYMENPLLYHQRKFDIRCFILVTGGDFSRNSEKPKQHLTCYLYTEGYLRTSSVKFSLDEKKLKNILMHLTNDGIQNKDSKNYGKHEQGNKISYEKFQSYLTSLYPNKPEYADAMKKIILPQIKQLIIETMEAVQDKIAGKTSSCFELYGYDFMVDTDLKVWLIEVNSNPCLEDWSCPLLGKMISNMLACMMKIAVDKPLKREQHTKDFESKAAAIIEDGEGGGLKLNLNKKRSKKGGIEGWSKPEESPVLSEAQIERRKRLQQRHDFEKIWSQEKKIFKNNNNKIMKKKVEGNVLAINDDGEAKEEPENVQEGKEQKCSGSNSEVEESV